jgi:hypothetical protein
MVFLDPKIAGHSLSPIFYMMNWKWMSPNSDNKYIKHIPNSDEIYELFKELYKDLVRNKCKYVTSGRLSVQLAEDRKDIVLYGLELSSEKEWLDWCDENNHTIE